MDFGHLPHSQLDAVNFALPPEPASNGTVLPGTRVTSPQVYVGCPRWGVKEWVGKLYPKGTRDAQFLDEYVKQFNCIEFNSTFYNLYDASVIEKWSAKADGVAFRFCPKVFQGISHEGRLADKLPLMYAFEKSIAAFGPHLGPAFLQLSDGFGPQRRKELAEFLHGLPKDFRLFVEVRHAAWFEGPVLDELVRLLRTHNKGLVITDTAGRRDVCHSHLPVPAAMVRFVANNLHPTDHLRIEAWVERIGQWLNTGLEEIYFIVHMDHEKHSPELAAHLIEKLNAACGLALKKPALIQGELF